jgi:hypothetical protein
VPGEFLPQIKGDIMKARKLFVTNAVIAAAFLLQVSGAAKAQGWDSCSARVQQDERDARQMADRYGYDSREAQHERAELQRDAQNCAYNNSARAFNDGDRDDLRYRSSNGYRGDQNFDGRYNPASQNGYRDGIAMGQKDLRKGKRYRPQKNDQYEDADRGYNRNYGDKDLYRNEYRQAFERGYADGYGSWR